MCFRDHSLKLLISYLTLNALVSFSVNGDNNKVIIRFELVHICGVLKIVSSTFLWLSSQSYRNRDFSKCLLYNSIKIKKIFILISAKLRASCKRYPSPCKLRGCFESMYIPYQLFILHTGSDGHWGPSLGTLMILS